MGAADSKNDISAYDYKKKANKSLYGEARLCKQKSDSKLVVLKDRFCEDKSIKDGFKRYLSDSIWKSNHFTTLSASVVGTENQYCGTCANNHKLVFVMEHLIRDLSGEISRRQAKMVRKKPVSEN